MATPNAVIVPSARETERGEQESTPPPRKRRKPRAVVGPIERRRQRIGWLFVAPFAVVFVTFLIVPLFYAFWMSLQTSTLAMGTSFTWFDNYAKAFTDPIFLDGLLRVGQFALIMIPLQMLVALIAALVLDSLTTWASKFSRLMIFLPYAIPVVIGALMWGFLYSPRFGPASDLFELFGLAAPDFLAQSAIFGSLVNIVTWQWAGYYMIIIYAALQGIDRSIYEAARIDGVTSLQMALRIKVPMISSSMVMVLIFAMIGTLQFFTEPQVLRGIAQGAIPVSYTPNMYAYSLAFSYSQFNYASAISFALGVVVFIGSYFFLFLTRKQSGLK
ncbi:sugar ABC transporter permease [Pseudoclavibacter sp. AY1F1]|uniref:carbohydrate ABC transporter permease n=1 Tax=Pseudoclavibacter sp. AY1F1 TaxID=2080583 RepID=UPI000CE7C6B0|nr:sugar ABC transporter permease [Pseudoclavibacter sp. AY1F1]PPF42673.1 sugar ABC transporter permease [Pseudoclavibacter sp. AY1F1]